MKKLRPHQKIAVSKSVKGLKSKSRGQLIMPCGSGKTLCGIHVRKRLKPKKSLILVPRLSLIKQLLDEYLAESKIGRTLVVCSDEKTAAEASEQYGITGVTNDPELIRSELNSNQEVTIFCTYPSSDKLAAAYALGRTKSFDLAIFDEAHRTCGGGLFSTAVRQSEVKIKKRLFMTATPRIMSEVDGEETEVLSMDDEADYGKEFHYLSFSDAIKQDILSDYRIAIFAVNEDEVYDSIEDGKGSVRDSAKQIAVVKAIEKFKLRKVFAFHNSIAGMNRFQKGMESTVEVMRSKKKARGKWWQRSLNGKQDFSWRQDQLDEFESLKSSSRAIVHNCKLFTEGVDCPDVDGIVFVDKKSNEIDIAQTVGRAIRPKKDGGIATIVIPVFVPKDCGKDEQSIMNSSGFSVVFEVLRAMKSHDDRIVGLSNLVTRGDGEGGGGDYEMPLEVSGFTISPDRLRKSITSSEIDPFLGTMPDSEIGRKFGINGDTVRMHRKKLGIDAFGIDWSKIDQLLGNIADGEIARKFNLGNSTIKRRRDKLGIDKFDSISNWSEIEPLLGTMSDSEIGRKFGINGDTVGKRRRKLDIDAFDLRIDWSEIDPLLGTMLDSEIGKKFGINGVRSRRKKLGIDAFSEIDPFLGTMPDSEIGKKFGISVGTVGRRRKKLGIDSFGSGIDWSKADSLLGTMPDSEIGRKIGVHGSSVSNRRNKLGIDKFKLIDWSEIDPLLGTMSDIKLRRKFGIDNVGKRRKKLGIKPFKKTKANK